MTRFFIALYRYFEKHKTFMWLLIAISTIAFGILASQIHFEENLIALFPETETSHETNLAFSNMKVKDKIFVEFQAREGIDMPREELTQAVDAYLDSLMAHDEKGLITSCLYRFDEDMLMNALDFVLNQAATFVTPEMYPILESWIDQGCPEEVPQEAMDLLSDYVGGYTIIDGHLFSPDSTIAVAYINPSFNSMDTKEGLPLVKLMRKELKQFEAQHPDVEMLCHGAVIEGVNNAQTIKRDLVITLGISLFIICIVICFCFKNKSTLPLLLSPIIYGALFALAGIYVVKGGMSFMAIGMGAVILGVAMSYVLHVLTHYKYVSDPEQVLRDQVRPVCLGSLTTIGAFVSLLFTTSGLLKDLGLFSTFVLIGTTLFSLVFLPHFFNPEQNRKSKRAFALADQINAYPFDKKYWLVGILVVVIIVTSIFSKKVQFDTDLHNIGAIKPEMARSIDLYKEKIDQNHFSMYYAGLGTTLDEAILSARRVSATLDSLQQAGLVYSRGHMQDLLIPMDEQQQNIDRWQAYWAEHSLPETAPSMAQVLIEADYEPASLPESEVLPDELQSNFVEQTPDGEWMVFVSALMDKENLKTVNDAVNTQKGAIIVDPYYYTGDMMQIIHSDFGVVLNISSLFVLLVLLLSYLDVLIALVTFMPMFLSWFVVQGMMAICGLDFNIMNIVISSFIFGIGVDYSIFTMDGLIDRERGGDGHLLVSHKTAILFSAFVLITVVLSLLFSKHPAIYSVGITTIIGMAATLLITLTLEPLVFRLLMRSKWIRNRVIKNRNKQEK